MNWRSLIFIALIAGVSCKPEPKQDNSGETLPETEVTTTTPGSEKTSAYNNSLELQGIRFDITADGNRLTVTPSGLEAVNEPLEVAIEGKVTGAEIEDLNADGWPEVFVYTQSLDETKKANVHAFSVFNGRSMGMVSFPPLSQNKEVSEGYVGGDEFAVVENTLVQRFILTNGNTRQIQYKLVSGEAMPALVIDKVVEY